MGSPVIAPSVLSADFSKLGKDIEMINHSPAPWLHVDVMDGVFVPNISFGFPILKSIRTLTTKFIDVHLMIVQPERYITAFAEAGADLISVHYEASVHLHRSLQQIRQLGKKAGVAINPHTSVELLEPVLGDLDLVCLMSVNPGFGGQSFIPSCLEKIEKLRNIRHRNGLSFKIEIDGGVTLQNASDLFERGADVLVAGNAVFAHENPSEAISLLMKAGLSSSHSGNTL